MSTTTAAPTRAPAAEPQAQAAPYILDVAHTEVGFAVRHLMVSNTKGQFRTFHGTLQFDERRGLVEHVAVEIDAASIDTRDATRDQHLRSPDFLDVANHPKLTFALASIAVKANEPVVATGTLTLRGVSRPVSIELTYAGKRTDPFGVAHAGFELSTRINRKEFGVSWNLVLDQGGFAVGDEIRIDISGEVIPRPVKA